MFTQIAPRYDLLNHLLSLQLDRLWRARAARRLQPILDRPDALVLDLCCGTGDLAFALARAGKARIIGRILLIPCSSRKREKRGPGAVTEPKRCAANDFFRSGCSAASFAGASFDLVSSAFGFRNLANYEAACGKFSACSSPAAPSPFWNSPSRQTAYWAISIAGFLQSPAPDWRAYFW